MNIWWHNVKQRFRPLDEREYLIKCLNCKMVQEWAIGWHYQNCCKCGKKVFDNRF